jgi:uncharacterized membrane protein YbhN (UPF0104 family)
VLYARGAVAGAGSLVLLLLLAGLVGACLAPFVAARIALVGRLVDALAKLGPLGVLRRLVDAVAAVRLATRDFFWAVVWSVVVSLGSCVSAYLSFRMVGEPPGLFAVSAGVPLANVSGLIPASFAGVGGNQLAAATIYAALAIEPKAAATASLLLATVTIVATTVGGLAWLPFYRRDLRVHASTSKERPASA